MTRPAGNTGRLGPDRMAIRDKVIRTRRAGCNHNDATQVNRRILGAKPGQVRESSLVSAVYGWQQAKLAGMWSEKNRTPEAAERKQE